ncbi:unnamed protein product [Phyllotreta striolata]|uniref:Ammonium transporter AmtB-like domain-containing protein n=1 Tax=Phyllotreta striolata TaxID=444603 RepID=A0A9N9XNP2_PHYSR|nr:unnamed protein product [Phyllotreta striolata]
MSTKEVVLPLIGVQLALLILFCVFGRYSTHEEDAAKYPMFQDVHVMIFIGFGFLMTFLKRYGFSSVGFTLLLGAFVVQWALLCQGFFRLDGDNKIEIGIESLYKADIAAASVMISLGAVLGRTSVLQLFIMGFIEIVVYSANSYLGATVLRVADAGGSIFVHAFGAYFGLAVSYVMNRKKEGNSETAVSLQESNYTSDLFAMIGTVFLWLYWPSFNAIELTGAEQSRAVVNTYLALAACTVTAFAASSLLTPERKFDMVHVQNSTLAGGVAAGAAANLVLLPVGAVVVGILAGFVSVYGYVRLSPTLERRLGVPDTCGVHNLHGMPGVFSGVLSVLMAAIATQNQYKLDLFDVYPARMPDFKIENSTAPRTAAQQAGFQALGLSVTLVIAIVTGLVTGFILKATTKAIPAKSEYDDATFWELCEASAPAGDTKAGMQYDNACFEVSTTDARLP